ncbi:MAG TPA: hypothetical protein VMF62_17420 [Acetobacteraceae bacterium]|nr:hypothetical protein [Acetobacteraceae bacterium]
MASRHSGASAGFEWAYRDLLIALLVAFMAMAALALIAATKATQAGVTQGSLVIQMRWDRASDSDMDLWVEAPGDAPVGFSHMADTDCNLLRDDLGRALDPESRNEEMVVCRGMPAGEWIVDAMLYRSYDDAFPVDVTVTVMRIDGGGVRTVLSRRVDLTREGQQVTVWRFTLDGRGRLVPGSVNELPMPLYGKR